MTEIDLASELTWQLIEDAQIDFIKRGPTWHLVHSRYPLGKCYYRARCRMQYLERIGAYVADDGAYLCVRCYTTIDPLEYGECQQCGWNYDNES